MNTDLKHTADQLRLAADILETGHPWEHNPYKESQWLSGTGKCPLQRLANGNEIRLTLATPPDGRPLHNPDNLDAEKVGVGYRLILDGEPFRQDAEVWTGEDWTLTMRLDGYTSIRSYRLPLSVPWPDAVPDPYAELKAARAQGKRIQCKLHMGCGWTDYTGDFSNADSRHEFRVVDAEPAFQLPPPPPGMQWHREDGWQEGDLPQGWRPLTQDDQPEMGDECIADGENIWQKSVNWKANLAKSSVCRYRTTRPLTFEHAGKTWTYHRPGDPMPCDGERLVCILYKDNQAACIGSANVAGWGRNESRPSDIIGWRYAEPVTKEVELGPEDVAPESVFRPISWKNKGTFITLASVRQMMVCLNCRDMDKTECDQANGSAVSWAVLREMWLINRSLPLTGKWNPTAWEPCHKTIPQNG